MALANLGSIAYTAAVALTKAWISAGLKGEGPHSGTIGRVREYDMLVFSVDAGATDFTSVVVESCGMLAAT
jgi:hypothetical protein